MAGIERRDLLGAGRGAANVHSALLAENRRAARDRAVVGDVPDPDSGNVCKSFHPFDLRFYGSIGVRGPRRLLDPLKGFVASVNDFFVLTGRAIRSIFRSPHYSDDIFMQMDVIGVGSLMIAGMTGFFGGAVTRASVFDPLLRLRHRRACSRRARAMDHATECFAGVSAAIPDRHGEFFIPALTGALDLYRGQGAKLIDHKCNAAGKTIGQGENFASHDVDDEGHQRAEDGIVLTDVHQKEIPPVRIIANESAE